MVRKVVRGCQKIKMYDGEKMHNVELKKSIWLESQSVYWFQDLHYSYYIHYFGLDFGTIAV
jgi:hypothetical protein